VALRAARGLPDLERGPCNNPPPQAGGFFLWADFTTLQRNEQIAEWIRLTEAQAAEERQSAQLAPIESRRADGKGHRRAAGINAASRELGIERTEAQRAIKIDGIAPAAKEAARAAGLKNNQSALLKVAQAEPERQAEAVEAIAAERAAARSREEDPERKFRCWLEEGQRWLNKAEPERPAFAFRTTVIPARQPAVYGSATVQASAQGASHADLCACLPSLHAARAFARQPDRAGGWRGPP
jgi:hypothetical protein